MVPEQEKSPEEQGENPSSQDLVAVFRKLWDDLKNLILNSSVNGHVLALSSDAYYDDTANQDLFRGEMKIDLAGVEDIDTILFELNLLAQNNNFMLRIISLGTPTDNQDMGDDQGEGEALV